MKKLIFIIPVIFMVACSVNPNNSSKQEQSISRHAESRNEKKESSMEESSKKDVKNPNIENPKNQESYKEINENPFMAVAQNATSTFSIDVDNASYTNTRRFIQAGSLPPEDAVRIEEFINYFDYNYAQPTNGQPFSINTEVGECVWNPNHKLIHIGLQGKKMDPNEKKPSNLVFLIDVSGSMDAENKLGLLKKSFAILLDNLDEGDYVSMVVYAGAAGLVLPPTSATDKGTILAALNNLKAGGSTAGGQGISLAYQVAEKSFIKNGNNRVIIASDGDFNVGVSSDTEMEKLIEEKRKSGIYITVLGFGMGNYKDSKMEVIADKGNGNYYYIDSFNEARKVLGVGLTGTLFTIAKDVKIQVEFNPAIVKSYRLIGYENRLLNNEDFEDDKKDAGEIGAGHTVTALYEVELVQNQTGAELMALRLRYKTPNSETSELIEKSVKNSSLSFDQTSENFKFSTAVTGFGLLLRNSQYKGNLNYGKVITIAKNSKGKDTYGYRAEFINLVETASTLTPVAAGR